MSHLSVPGLRPPAAARPFALTVVVPCLNEADNVDAVYAEVVAELGRYDELEVLFVDDGSTDDTLERIRALAAEEASVSYLSLTRNFGLEAAFSAGYRYAGNPWILHLDADLQFPPAEAHALIDCARTSGADAVFGIRTDRQDPWVRRAGSALHDLIARRLLGIEIPAGASSFRLVRSDLAARIVDLGLGTPYFLATLPRLTRNWTTVQVRHQPRRAGQAKVTVRGLARHAVELFVSFSTRTIVLAAMLCLVAAAVAVAGAVVAMLGPATVAGALLGVALSANLVAVAVVARYLVHVGRGQPRSPQFLIKETNIAVRPADLLAPVEHPVGQEAGRLGSVR